MYINISTIYFLLFFYLLNFKVLDHNRILLDNTSSIEQLDNLTFWISVQNPIQNLSKIKTF